MQHITKLCADHLRTFINDNHAIKLKSSHAHELVAAFFGYKSRAALLADTQYPISNLQQAEIIVMVPDTVIDQRRKELQELPSELPDSYALGEGVYAALFSDKWWSSPYPPFRSFEKLAIFLADKHARQGLSWKTDPAPERENVTVEFTDSGVLLTVSRLYQIAAEKPLFGVANKKNITTIIKIPRVAGHIGYGKPDISRNIDNNLEVRL